VIGSSGLIAGDYEELDRLALDRGVGVIAAGNFSVRGLHLSGADGRRPRDAVVMAVGPAKILWLLQLNGDPDSQLWPPCYAGPTRSRRNI
jgi:hypothetical protein